MSRAAILIALSRVLQRQPTPEDMATFCGELLARCPEGRVYVSEKILTESEQAGRIRELWVGGMGIRAIARHMKIGRGPVREALRSWQREMDEGVGSKSACFQTHP